MLAQPPSGGCVLKQTIVGAVMVVAGAQPPSGGCVLKPLMLIVLFYFHKAAAFGRLCVETIRMTL